MLKPLTLAATALALAVPVTASTVPAASAHMFGTSSLECPAGIFDFIPRIVRKDAVAAIQPGAHVSVQQICAGFQLNDLGNAAGLTRTIAANPTLSGALARSGWRPDNVVGIQIVGSGSVILYVYQNPAMG